ncbi:fimbria/pilus periplasmic chaperone [Burkholderia pyrrocinia]
MAMLTCCCLPPISAHASVDVGATRVVYRANEPEATVSLRNDSKSPSLVQVWIDRGDAGAAPSNVSVPFIVTPPVSRVDPGKGQVLRILQDGTALPKDKESVFWLNVLDIPPRPDGFDASNNYLQLAFRTRIKLFYRPPGLPGSSDDAPAALRWTLERANGHEVLLAANPTAYYVSLSSVAVTDGSGKTANNDGGMVAPGQTQVFPLAGNVAPSAALTAHYRAINDYGGAHESTSPIVLTGPDSADSSTPSMSK